MRFEPHKFSLVQKPTQSCSHRAESCKLVIPLARRETFQKQAPELSCVETLRRAAVEGILNQLADDFRTRRKIPQVGRWSRHRLATTRHFVILEHRNLSDNCSRSGMVAAQVSNGKTLRNPRASQPFGQLLSERRQRPDCQTLSHHSYTHLAEDFRTRRTMPQVARWSRQVSNPRAIAHLSEPSTREKRPQS